MRGKGCSQGICGLARSTKSSRTDISGLISGTQKASYGHATNTCATELGSNFSVDFCIFVFSILAQNLCQKRKRKPNSEPVATSCSEHFLFIEVGVCWHSLCVQVLLMTFYLSLFHMGLQHEIQNDNKKTPGKILSGLLIFFNKNF